MCMLAHAVDVQLAHDVQDVPNAVDAQVVQCS